jgi:hypothetical protein
MIPSMGAEQTSDDGDTPEAKEILAIERTDYFKIGLSLTAIILLFAGAYAFIEWDALYQMKPNEFGDFLAGIFGPLVLLWVVMGFLQQGAELKYSREALLLQAKELKASVEAQKNMGEAAWAGVHAERDARAIAENERVRTLQPVFTLHVYQIGGNANFARTIFSLANSGKDGIDVKLTILDANMSVRPRAMAKFTAAEQTQVTVTAKPKSELKSCILQLCYKDVEGRNFERRFTLLASDESLNILDPFGSPPP